MSDARREPSKAGLATAAALVGELVLLRLLLTADGERAYLLGHPIGLVCGIHARTGIPCPMCGVTRAVALTLHGDLGRALRLFPVAPVACLGIVLFALALGWAFVVARRGDAVRSGAYERRLRVASLAYAGLCTTLWLTDYAARVGSLLWQG
ncbi:MAG TPA: DUF2752 domain-containing protein [Polyangiaceae bacterium]|jgi:hypothetical protein|nr:DUF2752 domain-containing protein [Polyangiaceae bacterium]